MTTIEVRFIAGRYHATPWGRHVNEGEVAWPPEPWRVLRALVAAWHLKADHERFQERDLASLIDTLASDLPCFRLPRVTHSHLRSYMPVHEGMKENRALIFDGFLSVDPREPLIIHWPVDLPSHEGELLAHLLSSLGYLGRAESWCEAKATAGVEADFNSMPLTADERQGDIVELLAPMPPTAYLEWRHKILDSAPEQLGLKGKAKKHLESTIPPRLLDLLRVETSDFQAAGWSHVPGGRRVSYVRPDDWNVSRRRHKAAAHPPVSSARFALAGRPLPRVEDSVRIGELVRAALMRHADRAMDQDAIPPTLSGRENGETARDHQHAYFLPEDADGDGWIDHVLVHAEGGLEEVVPALQSFRKLWTRDGNEWRVLLEWMGTCRSGRSSLIATEKSIVWRSVTPYLHPWFRKKHFDYAEQIARELALRGLELAEIRPIPHVNVHGKELRPIHFHRFRSRRGLTQPDRQGGLFEIRLLEPATGPIALGFGSHYGLGLFRPVLTI
ncbi:MAG: type I-G CRISPR-associated protein Csb2 [Thermoanaerobaculia bacterium]